MKKNKQFTILALLAIVFFVLYSWFPYATTRDDNIRFASPDATANYFWINNVIEGRGLTYFEPVNVVADDVIVPRSLRSDEGIVKPVSFIGIILIYSFLAKLFSAGIILYITPLLTVVAVLLFYKIISKIFTKEIGFYSTLMLFALAPLWYYTSRSLFHNVLFIDLLLASIYIFIIAQEKVKKFWLYLISGIFLGLAVTTRTSELVWLVPVFLLASITYYKKFKFSKVVLFVVGALIALLPMLYYNQSLYGNYFHFGYSQSMDTSLASQEGMSIGDTALPFGLDFKNSAKNFINYFVLIFWYLFWPALAGVLIFIKKYSKQKKIQRLYFDIFFIISFILIIFYGSWSIIDNPNPGSATIGNSYTRYWLPMYIMSLPLVVMCFQWVKKFLDSRLHGNDKILLILITIFILLNFQTAIYGKEEGLVSVKQGIEVNKERVAEVKKIVESNAVIISKRFDKFLWPTQRVIAGDFTDNNRNKAYKKIVELDVPLYYYGFIFPNIDLNYLNNRRLTEVDLQIEPVALDEASRLGLYRITNNRN